MYIAGHLFAMWSSQAYGQAVSELGPEEEIDPEVASTVDKNQCIADVA